MKVTDKKVTMSDIAIHAGVSQPTVSLILNNSTDIKLSNDTKQRVLKAAQDLGYIHKKRASTPTRPRKVAFIFNGSFPNDIFCEAVNATIETAWQHNFILSVLSYQGDKQLLQSIEKEVNHGDYDGIIYASSMTNILKHRPIDTELPFVLLNCSVQDNQKIPAILPCDKIAAYRMTTHLIEQGYQRIALLTGDDWMLATKDRILGYKQAHTNHELIYDPNLILPTNWSIKKAYQQTQHLLALPVPPDAIFCCSDQMALGCYQAIFEQHLSIPKDIAVVGYDDQPLATEFFPPLTSIGLPYVEMGKKAVETLLDIMTKQPLLSQILRIEGELIIRESSQLSQ